MLSSYIVDVITNSHVQSAGNNNPVPPNILTLESGSQKDRDHKYNISKKGLFIIVRNNKFRYKYEENGENLLDQIFTDSSVFTYESAKKEDGDNDKTTPSQSDESDMEVEKEKTDSADVKSNGEDDSEDELNQNSNNSHDIETNPKPPIDAIKDAFGLDDSSNCLIKTKMTRKNTCPENSREKTPFYTFIINEVAEEMHKRNLFDEDNRPSYLMFFLMSAGIKHGQFLLEASQENCTDCKNGHKLTYRCQGRRVSDLVRAVQQATDENGQALFPNIPKIFVIQTVSGKKRSVGLSKGDKPLPKAAKIKPDDFAPRGSDTFVLYAHTENTTNWVNNDGGFYLINKFCEAVEAIKQKSDSADFFSKLHELLGCAGVTTTLDGTIKAINDTMKREYNIKSLKLSSDSIADSWFDNMCTTVQANISCFLKEEQPRGDNYDHLRAHISSTLRFRISVMDILKAEGLVEDKSTSSSKTESI